MSQENRTERETVEDDLSSVEIWVGVGVGVSIGLLLAGLELVEIADEQSIAEAYFLTTRVGAALAVSLGTAAAMYTTSHIRNR